MFKKTKERKKNKAHRRQDNTNENQQEKTETQVSLSLKPVGAKSSSALVLPAERISPDHRTKVWTSCWSFYTFEVTIEPRVHCGQVKGEFWLRIPSCHSLSACTRATGFSQRLFTEPWVLLCQLFFLRCLNLPLRLLSVPQTVIYSGPVKNLSATLRVSGIQFYLLCI